MATKKEETKKVVVLPEIDFDTLTIKIIGTSPLVTNPFPLKAIRQIEEKQQGIAKTKKHEIRNPIEDFIFGLYWLTPPPKVYTEEAFAEKIKEGARFGFHVGGIKNSAIQAAHRRGLVKNLVTARGLFSIVNAEQDMIYEKSCVEILTDAPPKMRKDCLSTFNSGADMRYRPQFDHWSMLITLIYDKSAITYEQLMTWFMLGGFACGLGENRAEKGDGWGSYKIEGMGI